MLLILAIPLGILIGFAAGGKLSGIGKLSLRWLPLVLASLVIQLLIFPSFFDQAIFPYATALLHILSYVLLLLWIARNANVAPILALATGATCNFVVLYANNGHMPASVTALQRAGHAATASQLLEAGTHSNLVLMSAATHLNPLGDVLYVPGWIPLSAAFSIGDLLITLALIWLIVKGMRIDAQGARNTA